MIKKVTNYSAVKLVIYLSCACSALWLGAQPAGFSRVLLQTQDLGAPGKIAVQARAEFEPGASAGKHTHPGEELG